MVAALLALGVQVVIGSVLFANVLWLRRMRRRVRPAAASRSVSVVIPARNEAENLKRLIPSLLSQSYLSFDVIVYDDQSDDGTWEVLQEVDDPRLRSVRGEGPAPGWLGKVHALYSATRGASGELLLFLDADAELKDSDALRRLVDRFESLPERSVMSGLTHQRGGAPLIVSLLPFTILGLLPLPFSARLRHASLGALNGQCWMIERAIYEDLEPHRQFRAEVLEDVMIGRYLKANGISTYLIDLQDDVAVRMYRTSGEAWRGFRKNAYLVMGGNPASFFLLFILMNLAVTAAPLLSPWLLVSGMTLKFLTDRIARFPVWISLLAPVSFVMAAVLELDSALHHWSGNVKWKGRRVA